MSFAFWKKPTEEPREVRLARLAVEMGRWTDEERRAYVKRAWPGYYLAKREKKEEVKADA